MLRTPKLISSAKIQANRETDQQNSQFKLIYLYNSEVSMDVAATQPTELFAELINWLLAVHTFCTPQKLSSKNYSITAQAPGLRCGSIPLPESPKSAAVPARSRFGAGAGLKTQERLQTSVEYNDNPRPSYTGTDPPPSQC